MDFTISIADQKHLLGLNRELAAQNSRRSTPLSTADFVQNMLSDLCASFAQQHLVTQMDSLTWLMTRFTGVERAAIRTAAFTDGEVADLCAMIDKTAIVHFDNALTIGGVALLEAKGLIAPGSGAAKLAM